MSVTNNSNGRVTWLLPVRNGMPYLPETLATIAAQTYTDWEILAWDNGSTDGTLEELQRWIPSRLPGRVVSGRPLPLGACLAAMVEEANTELCARIDADDLNLPDRLEKQVRYLQQHPEVALVGGQAIWFAPDGSRVHPNLHFPEDPTSVYFGMVIANPFCHPSVMFRRAAILAAGNYRDLHAVARIEDYDMWLRMVKLYSIANLPDVVLRYRWHATNVTRLAREGNVLQNAMSGCLQSHAEEVFGMSPEEMAEIQSWRCRNGQEVMERMAVYAAANIPCFRGVTAEEIRRLEAWRSTSRYVIPARDIRQRLAWARRAQGVVGGALECGYIARDLARKASRRLSAAR